MALVSVFLIHAVKPDEEKEIFYHARRGWLQPEDDNGGTVFRNDEVAERFLKIAQRKLEALPEWKGIKANLFWGFDLVFGNDEEDDEDEDEYFEGD